MNSQNRQTLLFVVLFVVLFATLFVVFEYVAVVRIYIVQPWTRAVAWMTAGALSLFDPSVVRSGTTVTGQGFGMSIVDGCNGITPLSLLVAGLLSFPTTWRARAIGFAIGVPGVLVVNFVRVLALYAVGAAFPDWFDRTHLYVSQAFVILTTGGIWLWWLGRFALGSSGVRPEADG